MSPREYAFLFVNVVLIAILCSLGNIVADNTTTLPGSTTPAPGPIPFGGSGLGYWELTNLTEQFLCVPNNKTTFANCANLINEIPNSTFHGWDNLSNLTAGKCMYLTNGPFNDSLNVANKTDIKRCLVTGKYTPRENLSTFDDIRFHFYNMENGVTRPIYVIGYWSQRHEPVNCVETPMPIDGNIFP